MSGKRKATTFPAGSAPKKQRKSIDLDIKMKIIKEYEGGKRVQAIADSYDFSHSTISTIVKDKNKVKEMAKASTGYDAVLTRRRKGLVHETEKLLSVWFDQQTARKLPPSFSIIRSKALSIFRTLKTREGSGCADTFTASKGWFQRFRLRFNSYNNNRAARRDEEAAKRFIEELDQVIEEGGYHPEQIFNAHETALFWKKMPVRTRLHDDAPGIKAFKDRVTLLLGGNVAGRKLKPFFIYRSLNPRALKDVNRHTLPVYYRANSKAWMTRDLFEDWFMNCFVPEARRCCLEKGIPFKILLLLGKAPGHPPHIGDLHPDVKVVYLPQSAASILQPMDQEAFAGFKAQYLRVTFAKAVAAKEDSGMNVQEFWSRYNILQSIKHVDAAWQRVTEKYMQDIWKRCLKRFVNNLEGFSHEENSEALSKKIVDLARVLQLEVEPDDVKKLLEYVEGELSDEDLLELEEQRKLDEVEESEIPDRVQKKFTATGLATAFAKISEAMLEIEAMEPNVERFTKVERNKKHISKQELCFPCSRSLSRPCRLFLARALFCVCAYR
ncbi:tigger transposable element-derived protein 1-like [Brachionichthys hirsutus]|uniref:tigger transposable element-derived protein 1-like n=1 Tax=Brachionichthys hirsutus TaxID=412623 RepID=UPI003604DF0A